MQHGATAALATTRSLMRALEEAVANSPDCDHGRVTEDVAFANDSLRAALAAAGVEESEEVCFRQAMIALLSLTSPRTCQWACWLDSVL